MKKVIVNVCTAAVVFAALPAYAAAQAEVKNEGLLYGNYYPHVVYSLPERIAKLKTEISKGEQVYTSEELKLLKRKLKEDHQTMRILNRPS